LGGDRRTFARSPAKINFVSIMERRGGGGEIDPGLGRRKEGFFAGREQESCFSPAGRGVFLTCAGKGRKDIDILGENEEKIPVLSYNKVSRGRGKKLIILKALNSLLTGGKNRERG